MSWKKAVVSGAIACVAFTGVSSTALADGENVDYTFNVDSPRYQYNTGTAGIGDIPFEASITDYGESQSYAFRIERITESGNFADHLDTISGESTSNGNISIDHNFNRQYVENRGNFPFRVVDSITGEVVHRGMVAEVPESGWQDENNENATGFDAIGHGDVVYNDDVDDGDFMIDRDNPDASIVRQGDYTLLHYRINDTVVTAQDMEIQIVNEETDENVITITGEDLQEVQEGDNWNNGFIPLNTDGENLDFIDSTVNAIFEGSSDSDNPIDSELSEGVYAYRTYDVTQGETRAYNESPLFISEVDSGEWQMGLTNDEIRAGGGVSWDTVRETEEIFETVNILEFSDNSGDNNVSYSNRFDDYQRKLRINYSIAETFEAGDTGQGVMTVGYKEAQNAFDLDSSYFDFELTDMYDIRDTEDFRDSFDNIVTGFGMDSTTGELLVVTIVMIATALGLTYLSAPMIVTAIAEVGMVGLFTFLGYVPVWVTMPFYMLIGLGVFYLMQRRE